MGPRVQPSSSLVRQSFQQLFRSQPRLKTGPGKFGRPAPMCATSFFRPSGTWLFPCGRPRLAPWAALFRGLTAAPRRVGSSAQIGSDSPHSKRTSTRCHDPGFGSCERRHITPVGYRSCGTRQLRRSERMHPPRQLWVSRSEEAISPGGAKEMRYVRATV